MGLCAWVCVYVRGCVHCMRRIDQSSQCDLDRPEGKLFDRTSAADFLAKSALASRRTSAGCTAALMRQELSICASAASKSFVSASIRMGVQPIPRLSIMNLTPTLSVALVQHR